MVQLAGANATVTEDIEVWSGTATGVDVANHKSFAWAASAVIVNDPQGNWEPTGFDADAEIKFLFRQDFDFVSSLQLAAASSVWFGENSPGRLLTLFDLFKVSAITGRKGRAE